MGTVRCGQLSATRHGFTVAGLEPEPELAPPVFEDFGLAHASAGALCEQLTYSASHSDGARPAAWTPGLRAVAEEGLTAAGCKRHRKSMNELMVGYARVSTEQQDLTAQRNGLHALGVGDDRIYVDTV